MSAPAAEQIRARILEVLGEIAPEASPDRIDPGKPIREQIDLDSFDFLSVIVRLHDTFGVDIPESDYAELSTLNDAVKYIAARCG
jgi:acyl carrier protein